MEHDALAAADLEALERGVRASPLVGQSTLMGTFQESRGFAFSFTRAGLPALTSRAPFLAPFLARALDPGRHRALAPWPARLLPRPLPIPNAFYLNALFLSAGAKVSAHVDATLGPRDAPGSCTPVVVAVLYLAVPAGGGGRLRLHPSDAPPIDVEPARGALLCFRGDLPHEVLPFSSSASGSSAGGSSAGGSSAGGSSASGSSAIAQELRVSLVCEQYALDDEAVAALPALKLHSRAGFAAYLEAARQRGGAAGAIEAELEEQTEEDTDREAGARADDVSGPNAGGRGR